MKRCTDGGGSLLETMLAMAIVAIVFVGLIGSFGVAAAGSAAQFRVAQADQRAISSAEHLQNPSVVYIDCAGRPSRGTYTLPDPDTRIESIEYLSNPGSVTFGANCTANDRGAQRITVVSSVGGRDAGRAVTIKRRA